MDSLPAMLIDENKALKARIAELEAALQSCEKFLSIGVSHTLSCSGHPCICGLKETRDEARTTLYAGRS